MAFIFFFLRKFVGTSSIRRAQCRYFLNFRTYELTNKKTSINQLPWSGNHFWPVRQFSFTTHDPTVVSLSSLAGNHVYMVWRRRGQRMKIRWQCVHCAILIPPRTGVVSLRAVRECPFVFHAHRPPTSLVLFAARRSCVCTVLRSFALMTPFFF